MDGLIVRPRNDMLPIRGVSSRLHWVSMHLERLTDSGTSLGIPDSNGAVAGSGDDAPPIGRVSNRPH